MYTFDTGFSKRYRKHNYAYFYFILAKIEGSITCIFSWEVNPRLQFNKLSEKIKSLKSVKNSEIELKP